MKPDKIVKSDFSLPAEFPFAAMRAQGSQQTPQIVHWHDCLEINWVESGRGVNYIADREYLSNKTDLGTYFAVNKGMSDVANAATAMEIFDGSQASLQSSISAIDGFYQTALNPGNGEFLLPLIGVLDDPFLT